MALALNTKTIAMGSALAATLAVSVIAGSGYLVSVSNYEQSMLAAEKSIHDLVVKHVLNGDTEVPVSVKIAQIYDGGFNRKMNLTINIDGDEFKLPFSAELGYFTYDFNFDVVNATMFGENVIKHFELDTLTAFNASAHADLLGKNITFFANTSYLNQINNYVGKDMDVQEQEAQGDKANVDATSQNPVDSARLANFKSMISYQDVGNAKFSLSIDNEENVKATVSVDSLLTDTAAITNLDAYMSSKGLAQLLEAGDNALSIDKLVCFASGSYQAHLEQILVNINAVNKRQNGNFDFDYALNAEKFDYLRNDFNSKLSNINISGSLKGLNINLFDNQQDDYSLFGVEKALSVLSNNQASLTINKGSQFLYNTMTKKDKYSDPMLNTLTVNLEGESKLMLNDPSAYKQDDINSIWEATPYFDNNIKFSVNQNLQSVYEEDKLVNVVRNYFDNSAKSSSTLQIQYIWPNVANPSLSINGQAVK